jgi:hypothetical protein
MKNQFTILANAHDLEAKSVLPNEQFEAILSNAAGIDAEGWALVAPFGRFPKTRVYKDGGAIKEQKFIQVLDNESADALLARENSLFSKVKRALIGLTIWKGHGDLNDHDKTALGNSREKIKLGTVDQIRKTERGIEAHFVLDNDGAEAVAAGWKFPSVLWRVLHTGVDGDAIIGTPFKLLSVALTQFPNISGVDSLANARPAPVAEIPREQKQNTIPDMKKLAGWLMAMGATTLANTAEPTEDQILGAMQTLITAKTSEVTSLGNEKTTLTSKTSTLENEVASQKKRADEAATTLANEQTARKEERKRAATLAVDLAITKGKVTVGKRDTEISTLENSKDFDADVKALLEGAPVVKIAGQNVESGKQGSALSNEETALNNDYKTAFEAELIATGQNPTKAHSNVMTLPKYAGLACRLVAKK